MHVLLSQQTLSPSEGKQSGVTSGDMRETREKNLFSTSSHMDKNTDGENRRIRLPSSIHKFNEKLLKKMNLRREIASRWYTKSAELQRNSLISRSL